MSREPRLTNFALVFSIMNNCVGRIYSLTVIVTLLLLQWNNLDSEDEDHTTVPSGPMMLTTVRTYLASILC